MPINLIAVPNKMPKDNAPKNKYHIILKVMHGDADFYEDIDFPCKDATEFEKIMLAMKNKPRGGVSGGDEGKYVKWLENNFGEGTIPYDKKFSNSDCRADVDRAGGFYYDENGIKWKAEMAA